MSGFLSILLAVSVVMPAGRHEAELRRHTGIPSVAVSPVNGRIWVTFYGGVTPGEDSNSYVPLLTSADGGKTWETTCVVEPEPGRRVFDPELWVAPDGRLRWTLTSRACRAVSVDNLKPYAGDEGDTKSDRLMMAELDAESVPTRMPSFRPVAEGVMMCKPAVLRDGTWMLPVARWYQEPSACFYASTDSGKTFELRGGVRHFPLENRLYDEHTLVELKNGDLLTFIRGKAKPTVLESVSTDKGRTWSVGKAARFAHTSSRHFLRRLKSGNLLLVKNGPINKDVGRECLMAYLSEDDGVTWHGGLMLDGRAGVSYPDGDESPDGRLFVVHDHDRLGAQEVVLDVFSENDVLAGCVVDPGSSLGKVVSRRPPRRQNDVLISDLAAAAGDVNWRTMAYETQDGLKGTMLYAAWGLEKPQPVKIPLSVKGRHRIFLGLTGTRVPLGEAPFGALVRLMRDPAPVKIDSPAKSPDAGWWFQPVEVYWKTADLADDTLVVERPSNCRTGFCWVRLEPVSSDETCTRSAKRFVVTNDAYSPYENLNELKAPIMRFADSSVRAVCYCVGNGPFAFAASSAVACNGFTHPAAHFDNRYAQECTRTYATLHQDLPHLVDELANFAHSIGLEFHVSFRTGCALDCILRDSPLNRADAGTGLFASENFCRLWDGTPVARLSYASMAVQDFFLKFYAEQLTEKVDGINLIWIRAMPAMLFEPAFRARFKEAYGEELARADDPRIVPLRKRILTDFLRRVRKLAGPKRVSLVVPAKGALCESFGLDIALLAREGIVDEFDIGDSLQTAQHAESFDYIDFDYFKRALAGTKATFLPFLWWCDAAAAKKGLAAGAAGAFLWDAGDKSWNDWKALDALDGEPNFPPTVHPLRTLDGFDAARYPWHVAY